MIEVFSTYNPGEIAVIKSVLDARDIRYFFQGENINLLIAAGARPRLLVDEKDARLVRDILRELGFL
jgi:hypothetical protein